MTPAERANRPPLDRSSKIAAHNVGKAISAGPVEGSPLSLRDALAVCLFGAEPSDDGTVVIR